MIKTYILSKGKFEELKPWLEKNISQENVRWWVDKDLITLTNDGSATTKYKLSVELAEKEEPMLAWLGLQL